MLTLSHKLCQKLGGSRINNTTVRDAYADFIQSYHWDYFATVTFKSPRKEPYYAIKNVWRECQKVGAARGFLVAEPHESGDLHIHGLLATAAKGALPSLALPWDVEGSMRKRFGISRVEACNSAEAVSSYCAKYVTKQDGQIDHYDILGAKWEWTESKIKGTTRG